ncbi:MFS transporter [Saccharothrix syringae]|uniref:MFS transporter n=1 Tax=Saccharothrix syringae TaxID=103733 RepID=A0A5Q0H192_SACSY|nr:MFS transporter [Saccharothrix syringae]QFZ20027.1 MFS transporter [Saccharothrix syringae]
MAIRFALSRKLITGLYAFTALNDFVPVVPVVALLFTDAGLDPVEVSSLFAVLAFAALALEVPSGAWADVTSRRRLLALGALLRALCFALWVLLPSYPAFVVGAVLWGACHALTSGTLEALVYDHLRAGGAEAHYPRLMGRARVAALVANVAATALAVPLLAAGSYALVQVVSGAVCLVTAAVALALPEVPVDRHPGRGRFAGYLAMLASGVAEVRRDTAVRRAALLAAVLPAMLVLDEYLPLLARSTGVATAAVPLVVILAVVGKAAGGWLAGRLALLRPAVLALALGVAAVLLAVGAVSGHPLGVVPVAVGLGVVQLSIVLAQARLQDVISGTARATVTSVAGLGTDAVAVAFYVFYAVGSGWFGVTALFAGFALVPLLVAGVMPRWLPAPGRNAAAPG